MLTHVILEGAMGKQFGRDWQLQIDSPAQALRLIDANTPGLFNWIRDSLQQFDRYRVVCEFEDGRIEELDNDTVFMQGAPLRLTFVPLVTGASAGVRFVVGAILVIVGAFTSWAGGGTLISLGVSMMIGAAIEMLTPRPKKEEFERKDKTSRYFDGATNTTTQGVPVPLIYGQNVLVGSHAISAALTVDEVMSPPPPVDTTASRSSPFVKLLTGMYTPIGTVNQQVDPTTGVVTWGEGGNGGGATGGGEGGEGGGGEGGGGGE